MANQLLLEIELQRLQRNSIVLQRMRIEVRRNQHQCVCNERERVGGENWKFISTSDFLQREIIRWIGGVEFAEKQWSVRAKIDGDGRKEMSRRCACSAGHLDQHRNISAVRSEHQQHDQHRNISAVNVVLGLVLILGVVHFDRHDVVEELADKGAIVHTCSRNESELSRCLQEWSAKGFTVTGSVCDVSSRPQREKMLDEVSSLFNGKLNILVGLSDREEDVVVWNVVGTKGASCAAAESIDHLFLLCSVAYRLWGLICSLDRRGVEAGFYEEGGVWGSEDHVW
ncbi:hypothetical protein TEA_004182 [Camellia sinensis var. sinensis]|uniref:Uncharacterized protein n=1 Tax=Camellia sinensis var. sinensis TaxID=542762 RepID=A0A4S4EM19_CAMSN|nr:hypothetical protein TEA_004182 [Camellia sinensis var. sinensis]